MTTDSKPKGKQIGVRVNDDELVEIDQWRRVQPDIPARPEAIRRLTKGGLRAAQRKGTKP